MFAKWYLYSNTPRLNLVIDGMYMMHSCTVAVHLHRPRGNNALAMDRQGDSDRIGGADKRVSDNDSTMK
jgi:hypothetical protein